MRRCTHGYTLLELVAATAITGIVLVSTMSLLSDSMKLSRKVETRNVMNTLCVSKMEEQLSLAAATFTDTTSTGNFAREGHAQLKYRIVRSDSPSSGGMTNRLMAVGVTVWDDANNNNSQDKGETSVNFSSKIAKLAAYQSEAKTP